MLLPLTWTVSTTSGLNGPSITSELDWNAKKERNRMDDKLPNSRWSESAHCPKSTEPATEVEAEIRAILTPGGQVDVPGSMADQPSDGSLPAYEASRPSCEF